MIRLKPYFIRKISKHGRISIFPKETYGHYCLVIPLKIKTQEKFDGFRSKCKGKTTHCNFSFLGKSCHVYTNGFTAQLKPMIPLIKKNVLEDCIKNPRKYLGGQKE